VLDNRDGHRVCRFPGGFVAGLDDRHTFTEHEGFQRGLQLNLTPLGARLFFDLPMSEIVGRVVHFNDLVPSAHRCTTEQLESLPDWDARFDFIEQMVASRISRASASAANGSVAWAYAQIQRSGGTIEMHTVAHALGCSRARLVALFRDQVGFPPKLVARIVRFERLIKHLKVGGAVNWADLAVDFGYYDQAHLVHDMRQFTGMTPTHARAVATDTPSSATLEELRAAG
jgi:AraC-like DNA-binding protein